MGYPIFSEEGQKYSFLFELGRYLGDTEQDRYLSECDLSKIVKEVEYLASSYKPNKSDYLEIFLYLSRSVENIEDLMTNLELLKLKYPFLRFIGDEVYCFRPESCFVNRFKLLDAISLYNPHISNVSIISQFWDKIYYLYKGWSGFCTENNIDFYPTLLYSTLLPGFNDQAVRTEAKHPDIRRNISIMKSLRFQLEELGLNDLYLCSFNEWHENTQVEDTQF